MLGQWRVLPRPRPSREHACGNARGFGGLGRLLCTRLLWLRIVGGVRVAPPINVLIEEQVALDRLERAVPEREIVRLALANGDREPDQYRAQWICLLRTIGLDHGLRIDG